MNHHHHCRNSNQTLSLRQVAASSICASTPDGQRVSSNRGGGGEELRLWAGQGATEPSSRQPGDAEGTQSSAGPTRGAPGAAAARGQHNPPGDTPEPPPGAARAVQGLVQPRLTPSEGPAQRPPAASPRWADRGSPNGVLIACRGDNQSHQPLPACGCVGFLLLQDCRDELAGI